MKLPRYGIALAAILGFVVSALPAIALEPARIAYVIDGDTILLESGERIRIAGIDSPETDPRQAKCRAEVVRGEAAKRDARALLDGRTVTIERVGRSYKRTVAKVGLDGVDVAAMLVEHGIAVWWPRGKPRPDWCGRSG